jgi:hypothetical protein
MGTIVNKCEAKSQGGILKIQPPWHKERAKLLPIFLK